MYTSFTYIPEKVLCSEKGFSWVHWLLFLFFLGPSQQTVCYLLFLASYSFIWFGYYRIPGILATVLIWYLVLGIRHVVL